VAFDRLEAFSSAFKRANSSVVLSSNSSDGLIFENNFNR